MHKYLIRLFDIMFTNNKTDLNTITNDDDFIEGQIFQSNSLTLFSKTRGEPDDFLQCEVLERLNMRSQHQLWKVIHHRRVTHSDSSDPLGIYNIV